MRMAAALASCRTDLVGTGWAIYHLVSTNGCRNHCSPLVGAPFPDFYDCKVGRQFSVRWSVCWSESPDH